MVRVCRPGGASGRVGILHAADFGPLKCFIIGIFERILPRIGQSLARNSHQAYNYLPESVSQFPQGEAFARRMRAAGLQEVTFHPFTFGIATCMLERKMEKWKSTFCTKQLRRLKIDQIVDCKDSSPFLPVERMKATDETECRCSYYRGKRSDLRHPIDGDAFGGRMRRASDD